MGDPSHLVTVDETTFDRFALAGTVLDGKYRVDELIAEGGFGVVYRGEHLTLTRPIAVKVLKTPEQFHHKARAAFIENFALEARTIARMSHPAIVQVLDFGVSPMPDGERAPWMVLEWLDGQTLEAALEPRRGRGGRTPAEALALLRPVFDALAYAHDEGVAHRDLKPANVMVVQGRRGATLKLMDFGIAKVMDAGETVGGGQTRTRSVLNACSPHYAAPEQISGTRTGPWTDVHALALLLTEVLTDEPPYSGSDMTAVLGQVLGAARPSPARHRLDVGSWEPVITRALSLRPDARFATAGEFLAALEAALPGARHLRATTQLVEPEPAATYVPTVASVPPTAAFHGPTTLSGAALVTNARAMTEPAPASSAPRGRVLAVAGGAIALVAILAIVASGALHRSASTSATTTPVARATGTPAPSTSLTLAPAAPPSPAPAVIAPAPAAPAASPGVAAAGSSDEASVRHRRRGGRTAAGASRPATGGTSAPISPRRRRITID